MRVAGRRIQPWWTAGIRAAESRVAAAEKELPALQSEWEATFAAQLEEHPGLDGAIDVLWGSDPCLDGPDGVAVTLTPDAAAETSQRLLIGAAKAQGQKLEAEKRGK